MDFIYQLGGVEKVMDSALVVHFENEQGSVDFTPPSLHIGSPVHLEHTIFGDAFRFLQDTVEGATPKLTIPSPSMVHYRGGRAAIDPAVYPELDGFWSDLTAAYRDEVRRLGELGCRYLQFDDTSLAYLNDPRQREHVAAIGGDPQHQHEAYIRHINEALSERPERMAVTTHMCRGNFRSSWAASGGYDFVAEALFGGLQVDGFFLEYDDARSGGFEPLRHYPIGSGKRVVLGLVSTKSAEVEPKDLLKRRIDEAARFVPLENLCISPQCGFASTWRGNPVSEDVQRRKLERVVEVAREVWSA
jgi:5-methyltetrahydropteroyltriglutamate--homocysteine methyltransferase